MDDTIQYLNTDLELTSPDDLTALTAALLAQGMYSLYGPAQNQDGLWYAWFELECDNQEPEPTISRIVSIVESLDAPLRDGWNRCTIREFNLGYDCGSKPWAFNQALSADLLARMAAVGASLRLTLYPPERVDDGEASKRVTSDGGDA